MDLQKDTLLKCIAQEELHMVNLLKTVLKELSWLLDQMASLTLAKWKMTGKMD